MTVRSGGEVSIDGSRSRLERRPILLASSGASSMRASAHAAIILRRDVAAMRRRPKQFRCTDLNSACARRYRRLALAKGKSRPRDAAPGGMDALSGLGQPRADPVMSKGAGRI